MTRPRSGPYYSSFEETPQAYLPPGSRLLGGRLELVGEVAGTPTAVVYHALDHAQGGHEVAVKVGRPRAAGANTKARYHNEARLGASLPGHPHIVRSLALGELDGPAGFEGCMVLVTELVRGRSLAEVMIEHPTGLPLATACAIGSDVARGLAALHERGIVHRDIKPGNVMLAPQPTGDVAKIIDFGIAYATGDGWDVRSQDLTAHGNAPGTPLYMSPQQIAHERPETSFDVYAWGAMFYELVCGSPPFEGMPEAALLSHKSDPRNRPYPLDRIQQQTPAHLAEVVDRCLAFDPTKRPSAKEILQIVDNGRPGAAALGSRPPAQTTASEHARIRTSLAAIAVVLVALLAVGAWYAYASGRGGSDPSSSSSIAEEAVTPAAESGATRPAPSAAPHVVEPTPPRAPEPASEPPAPLPQPSPPEAKAPAPPRVSLADSPRCVEDRKTAEAAVDDKAWADVLEATGKARCWRQRDTWRHLRMRAFHGLGRYSECVAAAGKSQQRLIVRRRRLCEAAMKAVGQ